MLHVKSIREGKRSDAAESGLSAHLLLQKNMESFFFSSKNKLTNTLDQFDFLKGWIFFDHV